MFKFAKFLLLIIACWAVPILGSEKLNAQSLQTINKSLKISNFKGKARYSVSLTERDSLLNGDFLFQQINPNQLIKAEDEYVWVNGSFEAGIAQGMWNFQFGLLRMADSSFVKNNHYTIAYSGHMHKAEGVVKDGRPDGEWLQLGTDIEDSMVKDTTFLSRIRFKNGIPQKSFKIENKKELLVGRFNSDGLAHDLWEVYSTEQLEAAEIWKFEEGFLRYVVKQQDNQVDTISIYKVENSRQDSVLQMGPTYFEILSVNVGENSLQNSNKRSIIGNLLEQNAIHYASLNAFLNELSSAEFNPVFDVKVKVYPLSEEEKKLMLRYKALYVEAKELLDALNENTSVKILMLYDEEVPKLMKLVDILQENHFNAFYQLNNMAEKGLLPFLNRQNLLSDSLRQVSLQLEASINAQNLFSNPQSFTMNAEENPLIQLYKWLESSYTLLNQIDAKINEKIDDKEQRDQLDSLEEQLIVQLEGLEIVTDSLQEIHSGELKKKIKNILSAANYQLEQYSKIPNKNIKIKKAEELIRCFEGYYSLSNNLAKIPERKEKVRKAYIDEVWNPFTSTVMKEEVKKRITQAYNMLVIPYLMNQVDQKMDCSVALQISNTLDQSFERILKLRDSNTQKIERKLKQETAPQKVMEILSIQ